MLFQKLIIKNIAEIIRQYFFDKKRAMIIALPFS